MISHSIASALIGALLANGSPPQDGRPLIDASRALTAAIATADATAGGTPPRLSDATAAPMIRAAFDVERLSAMQGMRLEQAQAVCAGAVQPMLAYFAFDLDAAGFRGISPDQATGESQRLMIANTVLYQDEVALASRFALRCNAMLIPAMENFLGTLPAIERTDVRRGGIAMVRHGIGRMYSGTIISAVDPSMRPNNRDLVLNEAVLQADVMAGWMSPADRASVISTIESAAPYASDPTIISRLHAIRVSMSRTDCGTICAY